MFSGLRCRDLPLNESVGSLCDYAKTSDSLEHLCLSGVLPDAARLSGTGALTLTPAPTLTRTRTLAKQL